MLLVATGFWLRSEIRIDSCLDRGGRWDEAKRMCEGATEKNDSPTVRYGLEADIRNHGPGTNLASLFINGLMPWPEHFFPKTCSRIAAYLPVHHRSPKGGWPRINDRVALTGILFVLKTKYVELRVGDGRRCSASASRAAS